MEQFITALDVRVITCKNVPPRRPMWQRRRGIEPKDRRTFRVCIPRDDCDKSLNADMWPEYISVSRWIFTKSPRPRRDDATTSENDDRSDEQRLRRSRSMSVGGATVDGSGPAAAAAAAAAVDAAAGIAGLSRSASTDRRQQSDDVTASSVENLNDTITDHHGGDY
jgi:hypothetical protein